MEKKNERPERVETDESLQRERTRTDRELAKRTPRIEADADRVLERARVRAESTLQSARDRADATLEAAHAPPAAIAAIEKQRESQDAALEERAAVAEDVLHAERDERARALEELLRSERTETDDALEVERGQSDSSVASRDHFLGMVSHDLRNLLGGLALSASVISKHTEEPRARAEAARIQRYTARMTRLVADLIDVVSMEAGQLRVTHGPVDAAQLVRDAVESHRDSATHKGLSLEAQVPGQPVTAELDAERIQQVLGNLLGNAIKFTPSGGHIEVVLEAGKELRFSVIDSGAGIDALDLERIFHRFWQSAPRDRRGLGLGLYISRSIVEAHGGRIWVERRSSGGSAFHFTLQTGDDGSAKGAP